MANPYFQFKKFTVYHDLCAMKVGIDGVLLGAWASQENVRRILDVGTGSGLIALMLAQRYEEAQITAIDIEENAIQQATVNIQNSPWKERIQVHRTAFQNYATNEQFDLIVSNPPYFLHSLKTPDAERTTARHADTLTHEKLILHAKTLLKPTGKIALILPLNEGLNCIEFAEKNDLYCTQKVFVYPKPDAVPKRILIEFSLENIPLKESELTIEKETRHQYSDEFTCLLKDFYLKL